jgi:hypothetical protein
VIFLVGWLGGWTVGGFLAWRTWLALAFGPRSEAITFGDGQLTFRPGLTAAFVAGAGNGRLDGAPSLQPRVVRRGQVASGLRLEPVGERLRLSIDCGADRVEVGAALSREERLWLHALLKEWAGGGKGEFVALTRAITSRPAGP